MERVGHYFNTVREIGGEINGLLMEPVDVIFDFEGNMIVTDSAHDRIIIFDEEGKFKLTFGATGGGEGKFRDVTGLAIDFQGNLVVVDSSNDKIQVRLFLALWAPVEQGVCFLEARRIL